MLLISLLATVLPDKLIAFFVLFFLYFSTVRDFEQYRIFLLWTLLRAHDKEVCDSQIKKKKHHHQSYLQYAD